MSSAQRAPHLRLFGAALRERAAGRAPLLRYVRDFDDFCSVYDMSMFFHDKEALSEIECAALRHVTAAFSAHGGATSSGADDEVAEVQKRAPFIVYDIGAGNQYRNK